MQVDHKYQTTIFICTWIITSLFKTIVTSSAHNVIENKLLDTKTYPKDSEKRKLKIERMSDQFMKIVMYIVLTALCYYVMKDSDFLHWSIGGQGSGDLHIFDHYPCQEFPPLYYELYLIKFSYYAYELYESVVYLRKRHDFYEMFVHHLATIILVYSTFASNMLKTGGPIMLLHNFTDIFLQIFKLFFDFVTVPAKISIYFVFLGTWIYCRMVVFPIIYIHGIYTAGVVSTESGV